MASNGEVPTSVDEGIVSLRQSCNGYVGNLTRRYNELERLMLNADNVAEVETKYAQLEEVYQLYVVKFQALKEKLGSGPDVEKAVSEFEARNQNRMEFAQRVTEYQNGAKSKEILPGKEQTDIPLGLGDIATGGQGSPACSSVCSRKSSTSSAKLREAKLKQELARLKLIQLERKQTLEKQKVEFAQRMEYLDAQDERERADLEVRMWHEETSGYPSLKEEFVKPQWTSADTTGQVPKNLYASMYNVDHGTHNDPINVKIGEGNVKSEIKLPLAAIRNDAPEPFSQILNAGNDEANCSKVPESDMTRLFQSISLSMNIPKPELISFDGDPAAYLGFINSFDTNIALRVKDDRSKLTYHIQFCKGKAKQSIENCVLMDAAAGYKKAREILYDQFGQPHNVTHALIGKILNREPIQPNDGQNLWDLARQMRTCEIILNQLRHVANMNSTDTLLKIQQLLPIYLQSEWAK
ncbi:hypothetical protein HOLleu_22625 [Holothuria leucospilota]|uniref:Uncharacterized protein n=1 Tax=Holothuria leucospilota TaxID=206669 RepID=A0A9Q1BYU1_HOLLE|nr:hypothetical protein HOLleu_22625 [Holothuria leucospilota]